MEWNSRRNSTSNAITYNRVQPFLRRNCSSKKNRDTRVNAKVFPFRGDEKKEKGKKRRRRKKRKEIGRSFSFISPTPRFENLKTRRGVAQVRIAQTQSTHQSRGTDAYRWLACSQSSTKGHFPSVSIIDDRPARVKRLTNCEKKKENLSLHEGDYYRLRHAPIIKFNIV